MATSIAAQYEYGIPAINLKPFVNEFANVLVKIPKVKWEELAGGKRLEHQPRMTVSRLVLNHWSSLFRREAYDVAIEEFSLILQLVPGAYWIQGLRGYAYSRLSHWVQALVDLDAALKEESAVLRKEFHAVRTIVHYRLGDLEAARSDAEWIIDFDQDATAYNNVAFIDYLLGKGDSAIEHWQMALRRNSKLAFASAGLAVALWTRGEHERAFEWFEQAIQTDSNWRDLTGFTARDYLWPETMIAQVYQLRQALFNQRIQEGGFEYIVANPNIGGGVLTFKGTRLPLITILAELEVTDNEKELFEDFETLKPEFINEARRFKSLYPELVTR